MESGTGIGAGRIHIVGQPALAIGARSEAGAGDGRAVVWLGAPQGDSLGPPIETRSSRVVSAYLVQMNSGRRRHFG
jgi:hypothetical protein